MIAEIEDILKKNKGLDKLICSEDQTHKEMGQILLYEKMKERGIEEFKSWYDNEDILDYESADKKTAIILNCLDEIFYGKVVRLVSP